MLKIYKLTGYSKYISRFEVNIASVNGFESYLFAREDIDEERIETFKKCLLGALIAYEENNTGPDEYIAHTSKDAGNDRCYVTLELLHIWQ